MNAYQFLVTATLATAIGALVFISGEGDNMGPRRMPAAAQAPLGGELPSTDSATAWLNEGGCSMDGIHDLGGMQGFGSVPIGGHEPDASAAWEHRVPGLLGAALAQQLLNVDEFRHGIERMDPLRYLEAAYYDRWYTSVERILIEKGVVTEEELEARSALLHDRPTISSPPANPPAAPGGPAARPPGRPYMRDGPPPAFRVGEQVVTRAMHPRGHTRLPRYARGKRGVIQRVHGVFVFPDTNAHGLGEQPQAVYSVRFDARELWADAAEPRASVALDLWESYLEAVPRPDTQRADGSQSI